MSYMHHVKDAKAFSVVGDLLVEFYEKETISLRGKPGGTDYGIASSSTAMEVDNPDENHVLRLVRLWRVLTVVCGGKKGSRLSCKSRTAP